MTDRTTYERLELLENKIEGLLNFTSRLIYYGDLSRLTLGHNDKILALQEQTRGVVANLRAMESHLSEFNSRIKKAEEALKPYFVEQKAKELNIAPELLLMSIDELLLTPINGIKNFNSRLKYCLLAEQIETVGQLLEWPAFKIRAISNLGAKSFKELSERLAYYDLKLKD